MSVTPVKNRGVAIPAVAAAMLYKSQRPADAGARRDVKRPESDAAADRMSPRTDRAATPADKAGKRD